MIDYLERKSPKWKRAYDFFLQVEEQKLNAFKTVPVLLIQLITLWHAGKDFGNSQLQLYCSMLDLLLERSKKNIQEETKTSSRLYETSPKLLPECFSNKYICQNNAGLLLCLAKLSYKALFNEQQEDALVFKSSNLEVFGISPTDLELCLRCGILSQSKVYGIYTGKHKSFSFLHKKVQEYLAAIHIVTFDNVDVSVKELKTFCTSLESILEMNQVWLFVAGMRPELTRMLFEHFADIASANKKVQQYRQSLDDLYHCDWVKDIQQCVRNCISEGNDNGHTYERVNLEDICLLDFQELESELQCYEMSKVKSVYINTDNLDGFNTDEAIFANASRQFQQCSSVQRLHLYDRIFSIVPISVVEGIVDNSCDTLTSLYVLVSITATDKVVSAICRSVNNSLVALGLHLVKMTHKHKEQILDTLSSSPNISCLELRLYCTDHCWQCRPKIDLTVMTHVQVVTLYSVEVRNLPSVAQCINTIELFGVTLPMADLQEFASQLARKTSRATVKFAGIVPIKKRDVGEGLDTEDMEDFFKHLHSLNVTKCEYSERHNTWDISFTKWCMG